MNLLQRTNNTLIQTFNPDNANELVNITRNNNLLTVAGSLNGSNSFTINGQGAAIYHDLTFAVTNSITSGLNVFTAIAVSNSVAMTNATLANLPTSVSIANDANGNLISDGLHGYDYDCANELTRVTVTNILKAEFSYDGFGRRRIRKDFTWQTNSWVETNEVHYVYDGMTVIQERAGNNTPLVTYTRGVDVSGSMQGAGGIGGLLARTDGSGTSFYHADGNGNITMLVNSSGTALAKYLYDPSGNPLGMWGSLATANTYRSSSMEAYDPAGMVLYTYRVYFPNLQRWGQRDPIGELGGINLYGFVRNNPLRFLDPLGLQAAGGAADVEPDAPAQEIAPVIYPPGTMPVEELDREENNLFSEGAPSDTSIGPAPDETKPETPPSEPPQGSLPYCVNQNTPPIRALSPYRQTTPGEQFPRFESSKLPSRISPNGSVAPGTFAGGKPGDSGLSPYEVGLEYNLPRPDIERDSLYTLQPPTGTWIIGPRPVEGGLGSEVVFPFGAPPGTASGPTQVGSH
jgi:RHS repeat-associated protein